MIPISWPSIKGNHDLPYKTPAEINFLYDILVKQKRNPFPTKLQWETDRAENGRIFWLEISRLDTDKPKEAWQVPIEPHSMRMLRKDIDPNSVVDFYANKSGAVIASIANNELNIKASCVKELVFYVVPQLVNFSKPLKIFVNGKLLFEAKVKPDKKVLLEEFLKTKDRELLVFNKIKLQLN